MPTKHTYYTYAFDELTTGAQDKAIEGICALLAGGWWDSSDDDMIERTMIYALAGEFKSPGWDEKGEGDFPGIDGLKIETSNLERRELKLSGTLTPQTAPSLPWPSHALGYVLPTQNDYGYLDYVEDEEPVAEWGSSDLGTVVEGIHDAINKALEAGQAEYDARTGREAARDYIDNNNPQFTEDGKLHA